MMQPYEAALLERSRVDDRLMILTAENRAAIRNLPPLLGDRFVDTGITEQTMVGMAAGLALRGRIPVAHALATFLTLRPFEFIRTDVGIPGLPVKLVGAVPGVLSEANGPTHQSLEDVALMRGIPNMRVFCPADLDELVNGLPVILDDPAPCYIRYCDRPAVTRHSTPFTIGQAEVLSTGSDVGIIVYGALFREAFEAAELLRLAGLSVQFVNLRMPAPADEAAIVEAARRTRLLVTIEDHFLVGGLHSIVAEVLLRHRTTAHVLPIAFDGRWFRPALLADVLRAEGLLSTQITERILAVLSHAN